MKRLLLFLAASSLVLGGCRPASDSSVYDLGQHRKLQLDDHEAADYLDITVDLGGTFVSAAKTNHYGKKARTVIGGTGWYISGDFAENAEMSYWLVGTNVVRHTRITSSMYLEQAKEFVSERVLGRDQLHGDLLGGYFRAGHSFTTLHSSQAEQPIEDGLAGVVWLAFCSGDYLKQQGRRIPMPMDSSAHGVEYSDETVVFDDNSGLPKSVELLASDGTVLCSYQVLKATNVLGRTIPLQFQLVKWRQGPSLGSRSIVHGSVRSIKPGTPPELPTDVEK
jgi:hypothetical protein